MQGHVYPVVNKSEHKRNKKDLDLHFPQLLLLAKSQAKSIIGNITNLSGTGN